MHIIRPLCLPVYSTGPCPIGRFRFWPPDLAPGAQQNRTSLRHRLFGVTAFMERCLQRKDVILLCLLAKFPVGCSFSSFAPTMSIQGLSRFPAPCLRGTCCHINVPGCLGPCQHQRVDLGFRMCVGNQLHLLGWIFDLVCYLRLIYKLFGNGEINVRFSGVVVVNKNISHLFIPCERKRKCV